MFPIKAGMIPFQMYSPMEISGVPTQMAMGINVILATTWSNPKETKPKSGHQIPVSFDATSQPCSPGEAGHANQGTDGANPCPGDCFP